MPPKRERLASTPGTRRRRGDPARSEVEAGPERFADPVPSLFASSDEEGRIVSVNRAWRDLLGWEPEELLGRRGTELTHPDDAARAERLLAQGGLDDGMAKLDLRLLAKDGSWRWVDWRVRFEDGRWYGAGQETRGPHFEHDELAAGAARLVEAERVAGIGSFELDLETGELSWSDEHFRIYGLEPGAIEVTPESVIAFTHPEDVARGRAMWEQLANDGAPDGPVEYRIQRADGAERILQARGEMRGDDRIVGTVQDITAARRAQQALEASERRYRALVEQVPAVVYTAALGAHGAWEFVSPHIERMLGYPPHDWTENSAHWFATVHPDDRDRVLADETHLDHPGAKLLSEYRMIARDGRVVHVRDEATIIENERGELRMQGVIVDVTAQHEAAQALAESEERYRSIVDTSQDVIFTTDAENRLTFLNRASEHMLGYEPEEMVGRHFTEFQSPEAAQRDIEVASRVMGGQPVFQSETQALRKDGTPVDLSFSAVKLEDADGNLIGATGTVRDITESKRHAQEMREKHEQMQAIIDNSPLTIFAKDLELRHLFVNREFENNLNLEPGEIIGKRDDYVFPPDVAQQLEANDRQVLDGGAPIEREEVVPAFGRERTFLVQKFPLRDVSGSIYGICGIAIDITERKAREDALRSKVEWSFRIRQAIETNRLVLHSQPIVEIATGETAQAELLLRMRGDEGRLVMPGEFLPPAERFGLAPAIDRWVVARAAQLARTQRVEVNLSGQSIGDPALTEFIEAQLAETGADPANMVFEITETTAAQDLTQARSLADRLTGLGCGFALDDFGTGYGSFTYLKHLPVAYIKIDMEFVRNLDTDRSDRQVVRSIVDVARNFDIKTIAEGVESQPVLELLKELGVDYAQGFHLGRPAPLDEPAAG